jgi:hypothetical protein
VHGEDPCDWRVLRHRVVAGDYRDHDVAAERVDQVT